MKNELGIRDSYVTEWNGILLSCEPSSIAVIFLCVCVFYFPRCYQFIFV